MHTTAHAPLHGDHVRHEHAICHDVFVVPVDGLDVAHEALPVVRGDRLERRLPRGAAQDAEDFAAAALVRDGVRFGAGEVLVAFCVLEDAHLVLERLPLEWQRARTTTAPPPPQPCPATPVPSTASPYSEDIMPGTVGLLFREIGAHPYLELYLFPARNRIALDVHPHGPTRLVSSSIDPTIQNRPC